MSEPLPAYAQRSDRERPGWMHDYMPTQEQLPTYTESIQSFFNNALRPAFLAVQIVSTVVIVFLCAAQWRHMVDEVGDLRLLSCVAAALLTACLVLLLYGVLVGLMHNMRLLMAYQRLSFVVFALALAAQVVATVNIYANRHTFVSRCIADQIAASPDVGPAGDEHGMDVSEPCQEAWRSDAVWDIVWLVLIVLFGAGFLFITQKYLFLLRRSRRDVPQLQSVTADVNRNFGTDIETGDEFVLRRFPTTSEYGHVHQDDMSSHFDGLLDSKSEMHGDALTFEGASEYPHRMDAYAAPDALDLHEPSVVPTEDAELPIEPADMEKAHDK
ncbi:hypothetical protein MSPP1_003526 [Malassezia sp. CBS 17886]|nr:hypothetical protein MSPP1_003526 [Malassezia sp. CBS 17886]